MSPAPSLRAVLWDIDGTLVDSAEYHYLAWRQALADLGRDLSREEFAQTFGQRNDTILRRHFGPDFPAAEIERIGDAKEEAYRQLLCTGGIEPLPGVRHWLRRLREEGWRQAVATSGPRLNVEAILSRLRLTEVFEASVSAEDVERGKPDPEVFLTAATRLGVEPARCVVVEDAPSGIEAAHRAGMRAVGVLSTHAQLSADRVVRSLEDLPADAFDVLLAAG